VNIHVRAGLPSSSSPHKLYAVTAMADTGASLSFMRRDVAERLNMPFAPSHTPRKFKIGDEGIMSSVGEVDMTLRFNAQTNAHLTVMIAERLPFDVIVGNDAWTIVDAGVWPRRRHVEFGNGTFLPAVQWSAGVHSVAVCSVNDEAGAVDVKEFLDETLDIPTLDELRNPPPTQKPSVNPELPSEEQAKLWSLIEEFEDVFTAPTRADRRRKVEPFRVPLKPGVAPRWTACARTPYTEKDIIEETIQEYLRQGWIRRSDSAWSARVMLVYRNNKPRFCVDFRGLNEVTVHEVFSTSYVWDILEKMGRSKYMATEDLRKAYHQWPVHGDDVNKLAFSTASGHYEFLVVPFGPKNAPAFFSRQMQRALGGLDDTMSYFDDICTGSDTFEGFLSALRSKFLRLRQSSIRLDAAKCFYGYQEMNVLGYRVKCGQGTTVRLDKIEAFKSLSPCRTVTEVRSFLGATGYYSLFISNFAEIAAPLFALMKSDAVFHWGTAQVNAFEELKQLICSAPILAPFDPYKPIEVHTDASNIGVGAVLQQPDHDGRLHPVAFASRLLTPAESRYITQEIECLALVYALKKFHVYLFGQEFTVFTDHQALLNIRTSSSPSARIIRWSLLIQQYWFNVVHVPGRLHVVPDALSRLMTDIHQTVDFSSLLPIAPPSGEDTSLLDPNVWRQAQHMDDFCTLTSASLANGNLEGDVWSVIDGILFLLDPKTAAPRLVVPQSLVHDILHFSHMIPEAGHQGTRRTAAIVHESFFWPGWKRDVTEFVTECVLCQQFNGALYKKKTATPTLPITAHKFNELVAIDIQGPFRVTDIGNRYTLNIQDIFSHLAAVVPLADTSAESVARAFISAWVGPFQAPVKILSDNGKNLVGSVMSDVFKWFSAKQMSTTPYHPAGNPIERLGRTLNSMVAKFTNEAQTDWDQFIGLLVSAYNTTTHTRSGVSPHSLVFREAPLSMLTRLQLETPLELRSVLGERGRAALRCAYTEAVSRQDSRLSRAAEINANADFTPFAIGTVVWLKYFAAPRDGRKYKHTLSNQGPYWITEVHGPVSYVLTHVRTGAQFRAHHFRITEASPKQQQSYPYSPQPVEAPAASAIAEPDAAEPVPAPAPAPSAELPERRTSRFAQRDNRRAPARYSTAMTVCEDD